MSKRCMFCGAELQDHDTFCTYCGKKQEVQPTPPPQPAAQAQPTPPPESAAQPPQPAAQPQPAPAAGSGGRVAVEARPEAQKPRGTRKIGILIAAIGILVAGGLALAGYLSTRGPSDSEKTARREERDERDEERETVQEPDEKEEEPAPAEINEAAAADLAALIAQSEDRLDEGYGQLAALQEEDYSEGKFKQYTDLLAQLRADVDDLHTQAAALEPGDTTLQSAADEYFNMVADSQEALYEIWDFMVDYFALGDAVLFYKPQVEDYSSTDAYLNDLDAWYQDTMEGYEAIESCPACMENQWAQYGRTLELNSSVCEKLYWADAYGDPLRRASALNMAARYDIADEVRYSEILDALAGEVRHSDNQRAAAAALAREIRDYAALDAEARGAYTFENIRSGEVLLDYDVVDTIYPSLYNSYDAFLVIKTGCVSGTRSVLVEAEIPGLTQVYRESFTLDSAYKAIYIKPPALTGELSLDAAKNAQINVTVTDQAGTVLDAKSFPITIKSKYDFEWYSDEYGLATQDNILCFMTPEAKAIVDLKRQAIDEISEITNGQMESFVGYQGNAWNDHFVGTYLQAAGIMRALYESGVRYNMDPFSLSGSNQHILFPEDVLSLKSGLCVETSLVVASALQSAGMHAFLVFPPGHAQVAVEIWNGRGSDTRGTGQYFLIETTGLSADWNNTGIFRENAQALLEGRALNTSPIYYYSAQDWESYIDEDTYVVDCDDYGVLGITPFAN